MNRLHKYLPSYYKQSETFKEITNAESNEFDRVYDNISDLSLQFVVDTATWGLAIYEKELQLPIKPNKTLDERRSIIKAKMRGVGKVDYIMIKAIVEAFTGSDSNIEFNGKIIIVFDNKLNLDISDYGLYHSLDEIKPAHLDFLLENRIFRRIAMSSQYRNGDVFIPPCNTILSGTWWYQQNEGRVRSSIVKLNSSIKGVVFALPETAMYITSTNINTRYDFATQLSLKKIVIIESLLKSTHFNYKKADELLSGIYPDIMNKVMSIRNELSLNNVSKVGGLNFPLCNTQITKGGE